VKRCSDVARSGDQDVHAAMITALGKHGAIVVAIHVCEEDVWAVCC
jgi:hypothetical protein